MLVDSQQPHYPTSLFHQGLHYVLKFVACQSHSAFGLPHKFLDEGYLLPLSFLNFFFSPTMSHADWSRYLMIPVPHTCNISEGVLPRPPPRRSDIGTFIRQLTMLCFEMAFSPPVIVFACWIYSVVTNSHCGSGSSRSWKWYLQSRNGCPVLPPPL